ncbi:hypothetical protein GDO81_026865 [Engystomops pustulosus]|uniref:Uncharacterized protein n=1 Tax=Engystomops pustulosus TaxID=76066 RepID=A0AAV6Z034_ENGPU|nr:hypothetical protein GDO81_026865 [Engystomops pustulosus]
MYPFSSPYSCPWTLCTYSKVGSLLMGRNYATSHSNITWVNLEFCTHSYLLIFSFSMILYIICLLRGDKIFLGHLMSTFHFDWVILLQ